VRVEDRDLQEVRLAVLWDVRPELVTGAEAGGDPAVRPKVGQSFVVNLSCDLGVPLFVPAEGGPDLVEGDDPVLD
jgi:hypothetical protein